MPLQLTGKPLIICEGGEDSAFVKEMIRSRGLQQFDISVIGDHSTGFGLTGLKHHLTALAGVRDFHAKVRDICLFADSDNSQSANFKLIQDHIREANLDPTVKGVLPVPRAPFKKAKKKNVTFTVVLQPGGNEPGCLETVIWKALSKLHPEEVICVDKLVTCAGISSGRQPWGVSKLDKARVRAAIAIIHRDNPAQSLSSLWIKSPNLIPITDPEFNQIFVHLSAI